MIASNRIDAADVRSALTAVAVFDYYKVAHAVRGHEIRTKLCPTCGERSRDSVSIAAETGLWLDHSHGCKGDLLALLAGYAGLDVQHDFERVLELGAKIAGIQPSSPPSAVELATRRAEQLQRERERHAMKSEAKSRAASEWEHHRRRRYNPVGERYLRIARGIDPRPLVDRDLVRFTLGGDIAVPLWSFDGELVNVVRRLTAPAPDAPKVVGLRGCPTSGTLCGRIQEISRGDTVVVAEGVTDALTAAHMWPDAVVLGAHGAARFAEIASAAAPRVVAAGGRLVLVPDTDEPGKRAGAEAVAIAVAAGLVLDRGFGVVDLGGHADLNAAHVARWRS